MRIVIAGAMFVVLPLITHHRVVAFYFGKRLAVPKRRMDFGRQKRSALVPERMDEIQKEFYSRDLNMRAGRAASGRNAKTNPATNATAAPPKMIKTAETGSKL